MGTPSLHSLPPPVDSRLTCQLEQELEEYHSAMLSAPACVVNANREAGNSFTSDGTRFGFSQCC